MYDNIEQLPDLKTFENKNKNLEKLLIVDDFTTLTPKQQKKIIEYLISGRKFGFTVILLVQNYNDVHKTLVRNVNYFVVFKLNDLISIKNIIRNHALLDGNTNEKILDMYFESTKNPQKLFYD